MGRSIAVGFIRTLAILVGLAVAVTVLPVFMANFSPAEAPQTGARVGILSSGIGAAITAVLGGLVVRALWLYAWRVAHPNVLESRLCEHLQRIWQQEQGEASTKRGPLRERGLSIYTTVSSRELVDIYYTMKAKKAPERRDELVAEIGQRLQQIESAELSYREVPSH